MVTVSTAGAFIIDTTMCISYRDVPRRETATDRQIVVVAGRPLEDTVSGRCWRIVDEESHMLRAATTHTRRSRQRTAYTAERAGVAVAALN